MIRLGPLPPSIPDVPNWHWATSLHPRRYEFCDGDYMLINNNYLGPYLNKAKAARYVTDKKGREFIELLF